MNKEKQLRELVNQYGIDTIKKQLKSFETKESPEKWFKNLLSQMTIKQDREKYPYSLFFFWGMKYTWNRIKIIIIYYGFVTKEFGQN